MFRAILKKFSKKDSIGKNDDEKGSKEVLESRNLATNILDAVGGQQNIKNVDACITRLRISVKDIKKVDKSCIKTLGAKGVLEIGDNIQAIFGSTSYQLKEQINDIICKNITLQTEKNEGHAEKVADAFVFASPISGKLLALEDVPDEVFSKKMLGDGFAIEPISGEVVSPVNGKIEAFFPTKHAIGIIADNGSEILIHFGIDTVNLNGEGFEALVKQGDTVEIGQPILCVNLSKVKNEATSAITAIVFTNLSEGQTVVFQLGLDVKAGQREIINIK